jgi:hypothetical protein
MQEALPSVAVLPYALSPESGHLVLGGRCEDVRKVVRLTCDPSQLYMLDEAASRRVGGIIADHSGPGGVELADPRMMANEGAFVLAPRGQVSDAEIRQAVARSFVGPIAVTADDLGRDRESPLVPWLYGGLTAAAICISLAALVMATDGFLRARRENEVLKLLGLTSSQMTKFELSQFGFAYGVTAGTSFLVGCALCMLLTVVGDSASVPWTALGVILLGLVAGALAAGGSLAVFGRLQKGGSCGTVAVARRS